MNVEKTRFSSRDEEEEKDKEKGDEPDYSIGIGKYLEKVKAGQLHLHKRLIACLSFQKSTLFPLP
jgi:hypothetical protein